MSYVSVREAIASLPSDRACAVAACNVHNMEFAQAVAWAARDESAPVILMIGEAMIPFAGLDMLASICRRVADEVEVPVAVALDHGKNPDHVRRCIELGLSVMFDGSHLPFAENVARTAEFARMAHDAGVSLEGELGAIGGSEDDEEEVEAMKTDPALAIEFAERTGVDSLAISIGNRHGFYRTPPVLDAERLAAVRRAVRVPLVLHGGSDVPESEIRKVIDAGIRKINVGTDLKFAFFDELRRRLTADPMPFQPPHVLAHGRDAVRRVTRGKIALFGSSGTIATSIATHNTTRNQGAQPWQR